MKKTEKYQDMKINIYMAESAGSITKEEKDILLEYVDFVQELSEIDEATDDFSYNRRDRKEKMIKNRITEIENIITKLKIDLRRAQKDGNDCSRIKKSIDVHEKEKMQLKQQLIKLVGINPRRHGLPA